MEEESKLTKLILSPNISGVYVSKSDLQAIAMSLGYALQFQERKRMLVELFALVKSPDDFTSIIDAIAAFFKHKAEVYKSISGEYKSAQNCTNGFLSKIGDALKELDKTKEEAALLA